MKPIFAQNSIFYVPYAFLLVVCSYFVVHFTKIDIHLWINQFHAPWANYAFRFLTLMGDGIFLPVYLVIMMFIRYRYMFLLVLVFLISGLIVQILKRFVFDDYGRPAKIIGEANLYLVPGVKQLGRHSFPSGHSATAFGMMFTFAYVLKNKWLKFGTFVLACLIAFSRVYLSQHFLIDTMVGSFIGFITVFLMVPLVEKMRYLWINDNLLITIQKQQK